MKEQFYSVFRVFDVSLFINTIRPVFIISHRSLLTRRHQRPAPFVGRVAAGFPPRLASRPALKAEDGHNCGFLTTVAALAANAEASYILEETFDETDIRVRGKASESGERTSK